MNASTDKFWDYATAFDCNRGLISTPDQDILRKARVAVAGLGGVGGVDLVALARLGIGSFTIADPDVFEIRNTNRQYGAALSTIGKSKAEVMAAIVRDINPEATVKVMREAITRENVDEFLAGADVLVDGIDAFEIDVRRLLFCKARARGIYALGAGPVGFSTVWTIFSPQGMTFDDYFAFTDAMSPAEKFVAYVVGMAPAATQRGYFDLSFLSLAEQRGPSAGLACQLASGIVAAEVLKILLRRGRLYPAPHYQQFDAYLGKMVRGRLVFGNRGPLQVMKRKWLLNLLGKEKA